MQTILGAGGVIGVELAKALTAYTKEIRLVSRNPQKVNATDQLVSADLTSAKEIRKATEGSSVVYVTIGFPYKLKVWKQVWPDFMTNVIAACKEHKARLVFFDNIYMYDANRLNGMTEETPENPPSKKGEVRARIARMLMDEVEAGALTALIARSADFYGPRIKNASFLIETVVKPLAKGGKANLIGWENHKHSFTYTPDAGKATAMLGNTDDAYNQVWHLPTAPNPFTGKEWVENIAGELDVKPQYRNVSKSFVKVMGWFSPIMKELVEMLYQYDRDYVFNSDKFEKRFNFKPTPYAKGIQEMIKGL